MGPLPASARERWVVLRALAGAAWCAGSCVGLWKQQVHGGTELKEGVEPIRAGGSFPAVQATNVESCLRFPRACTWREKGTKAKESPLPPERPQSLVTQTTTAGAPWSRVREIRLADWLSLATPSVVSCQPCDIDSDSCLSAAPAARRIRAFLTHKSIWAIRDALRPK